MLVEKYNCMCACMCVSVIYVAAYCQHISLILADSSIIMHNSRKTHLLETDIVLVVAIPFSWQFQAVGHGVV